jgi:hypothetical protein
MNDLYGYDVLMYARACGESAKTILDMAKAMNIKIIIDWDDNPFDFQPDHPDYIGWKLGDTPKTAKECAEMADAIIVTNKALAEKFSEHNANVFVVPNAWDDYTYPEQPTINPPNDVKQFFYRGASAHNWDVFTATFQFVRIARTFPNCTIDFHGYYAWWLVMDLGNVRMHSWKPLAQYFKGLKNHTHDVGLIPINNNDFNVCKSNIAQIEMTYAGIPTISPNYIEGFVGATYSNIDEFGDFAIEMANDNKIRQECFDVQLEMFNTLLLSKVNPLRNTVIEGI